MVLRQRLGFIAHIFIWIFVLAVEANFAKDSCPIGFNLAFTKDKEGVCYKLKGPEPFEDKFDNCAGNQYTTRLYNSLNFTKPEYRLWAEFKTLYPGGPFIDWSYSLSTGNVMIKTFEVNYNEDLLKEEVNLCALVEPRGNYSAVRCTDEHYRYCFVKPYEDDRSDNGCTDLQEYYRFWSPRATCLGVVPSAGGGSVRATWNQAQELCIKRGGSLLQRGWRYANNELVRGEGLNITDPLGLVMAPKDNLVWWDSFDGSKKVPKSEWSFRNEVSVTEMSMVALNDHHWHLVDGNYIFYNVICERPIILKNVSLRVTYSLEGQLSLHVNESTIDEDKIWCFSDSVVFYPSKVSFTRDSSTGEFVLKPLTDGYYWCLHADSINYKVSESNKELFIREKTTVQHNYAVKIRVRKPYNFDNIESLLHNWSKKLSEFIFYWSKYRRVFGKSENVDVNEGILKKFKETNPGIKYKDNVIHYLKIRRVYLDGKTVLLHIQLNPEMEAVTPGFWEGLEVIYMKPTYYCYAFGTVPMTPLGNSRTVKCRRYTCLGNFNEGVQWVETAIENCIDTPSIVQSTIEIQTQPQEAATTKPKEQNVVRSVKETEYPSLDNGSSEERLTAIENTTINVTTPAVITTNESYITTTMPYITTIAPEIPTTTEIHIKTTTDTSDSDESSYVPVPVTIKPPPLTLPPPTTWQPITKPPPPPTTTLKPEIPTTVNNILPDQQLQNVINNLQQLANQTIISTQEVSDAFDTIETLLDIDDPFDIPGDFLHLLDEIGAKCDLNGTNIASTIRSNVALVVAETSLNSPIRGLRIATRANESFTESAFEVIENEFNSTMLSANDSEAVINLPDSIVQSERRVSFVVFRNDKAFQPASGYELYDINSRVISVNIENVTTFDNNEAIDLHFRSNSDALERNVSRVCAYWHFFEDGTGMWSQEGCTFIPASEEGLLDTCRCNHLTHFAEVIIPVTRFSERDESALEILSIIGCLISIAGILMICLTAALFRSWRRDFSNKIWLQLCIAILMMCVCFLSVAFSNFQGSGILCMLVGVALHYFTLASFCWMLVAAVLSYRRLVLVFTREASHKLLRASAFSWGAPCAVIGILLSISPKYYTGRFEELTPSGSFCYPSGLALWLAVYAPIAIMLLANWTLFILIVRSVFASRGIQRHGDSNEALRCATVSCLLVFLFGLPWIFGLFASNIVMAYLFSITANYQGFVLFVFFVLGNKKTRDLWLNKLKIKQTRKIPVTSSTYTNKSSERGWKGGSGAASIEANSSKPRSLAISDDSRFS